MSHNYVTIAANHFAKRFVLSNASTSKLAEGLQSVIAKCMADTYAGHAYVVVDTNLALELRRIIDAMPEGDRPLVLWQNRLYLARYFHCEERLSGYLSSVIKSDAGAVVDAEKSSLFEATVNRFLPADSTGFNLGQRNAVKHALFAKFTVISGGPGTGKTTTVRALLQCFRALHPKCRIALVAPTGKAASRLSEADTLHVNQADAEHSPAEVSTLHKLIGRKPNGSVSFDAHRNLPHDLIVVDEASMVDLVLADQLIAALAPTTHLVLLGDSNQLDAVETGTFFHELCRPSEWSQRWLCKLIHTFRFDANSSIAGAAKAIEASAAEQIGQFIQPIAWQTTAAQVEVLANGYGGYVQAVVDVLAGKDAAAYDAKALFNALNSFRVLVAVNEGLSGQKQLANALDRVIRLKIEQSIENTGSENQFADLVPSSLFHGQALVFTKNNALLGVNNGDLAIVLKSKADPYKVLLSDGRLMSANLLQDYALAWAMTVHKSQGSEFDEVAFVMPGRAVDRALLYTAVTRAKKQFVAYGTVADIEASVTRTNPRRASIIARLGFLNPL
jgi:exodeoxyribonuclease V alpha subunit